MASGNPFVRVIPLRFAAKYAEASDGPAYGLCVHTHRRGRHYGMSTERRSYRVIACDDRENAVYASIRFAQINGSEAEGNAIRKVYVKGNK